MAYLFWLVACLIFVAGYLFCNENNVDSLGSVLSRGIALFFMNALVVYWKPLNYKKSEYQQVDKKSVNLLIIRHIIQSLHGLLFAEAQFYLSLPVNYTIYFSGPIFVLIMECKLYGQTVTKRQTIGVVLATIGVL